MIAQLEKQMAGLNLEDSGKSPLAEAQEAGKATVGRDERKIVTADRKTKKGKDSKAEAEAKRVAEKKLFKATLKKQAEME